MIEQKIYDSKKVIPHKASVSGSAGELSDPIVVYEGYDNWRVKHRDVKGLKDTNSRLLVLVSAAKVKNPVA